MNSNQIKFISSKLLICWNCDRIAVSIFSKKKRKSWFLVYPESCSFTSHPLKAWKWSIIDPVDGCSRLIQMHQAQLFIHLLCPLSFLSPTSFVAATHVLLPICPFYSPSLPVLLFCQRICSSHPLSLVLPLLVSCGHCFFLLIVSSALTVSWSAFFFFLHSTCIWLGWQGKICPKWFHRLLCENLGFELRWVIPSANISNVLFLMTLICHHIFEMKVMRLQS